MPTSSSWRSVSIRRPVLAENGINVNSWGGIVVNDKFETTRILRGGASGADLVVTVAYDGRGGQGR